MRWLSQWCALLVAPIVWGACGTSGPASLQGAPSEIDPGFSMHVHSVTDAWIADIDGHLDHWDATHWATVPLPQTFVAATSVLIPAGANAVWIVSSGNGSAAPRVGRLNADGTFEDHTSDLGALVLGASLTAAGFDDHVAFASDTTMGGQLVEIVWQWDGARFSVVTSPPAGAQLAYANAANDLFAVSSGAAFRFDGQTWSPIAAPGALPASPWSAVSRVPGHFWAASPGGALHWDGQALTFVAAPASGIGDCHAAGTGPLSCMATSSIAVTADDRVAFVGTHGEQSDSGVAYDLRIATSDANGQIGSPTELRSNVSSEIAGGYVGPGVVGSADGSIFFPVENGPRGQAQYYVLSPADVR